MILLNTDKQKCLNSTLVVYLVFRSLLEFCEMIKQCCKAFGYIVILELNFF